MSDLGIHFEVVVSDAEEIIFPNDPRRTAIENSVLKHRWCLENHPGRTIITADTVIDFNGHCVEKPVSIEEAFRFFRDFSGKTHIVITAVTFSSCKTAQETSIAESSVLFKKLDDDDIRKYFSLVDPMDKAGAYDIDQSPEIIIDSYSGSRTNIMGLPVEILQNLDLN